MVPGENKPGQGLDPREFHDLPPEKLAGIRVSLWESALSNVMFVLVGGTYLTAFALLLGADPLHIGLIASLPALANLLQIVGSYLVQRTGQRKRLTIIFSLFSRLAWLMILPLPWLVFGLEIQGIWILISLLAVSNIFGALAGAAWLSWLTDLVPSRLRGRFLSRRSMIAGVAGMTITLLAGHFLDIWNSIYTSPRDASLGIVILFSVGVTAGLWSQVWLGRIPDYPLARAQKPAFWGSLREPLRDTNFRAFLVFSFMWAAMVGLSSPFFAVHMITYLAIPFSIIAALSVVSGAFNILGLRIWGRMTDESGAKPFLRLCCLGAGILPLVWLLARPEAYLILWPLHAVIGLAWAGIGLTTSALLMNMAPQGNNAVYFALYAAVSGISGALAPMLGGVAGNLLAGVEVAVGPVVLESLHFVFITSSAGRILVTIFLLGRVSVPDDLRMRDAIRKVASAQRQGLLVGTRRASTLGWQALESTGVALARGTVFWKRRLGRTLYGRLPMARILSRNASGWESRLLHLFRWLDLRIDHAARLIRAILSRIAPSWWKRPGDRDTSLH